MFRSGAASRISRVPSGQDLRVLSTLWMSVAVPATAGAAKLVPKTLGPLQQRSRKSRCRQSLKVHDHYVRGGIFENGVSSNYSCIVVVACHIDGIEFGCTTSFLAIVSLSSSSLSLDHAVLVSMLMIFLWPENWSALSSIGLSKAWPLVGNIWKIFKGLLFI